MDVSTMSLFEPEPISRVLTDCNVDFRVLLCDIAQLLVSDCLCRLIHEETVLLARLYILQLYRAEILLGEDFCSKSSLEVR